MSQGGQRGTCASQDTIPEPRQTYSERELPIPFDIKTHQGTKESLAIYSHTGSYEQFRGEVRQPAEVWHLIKYPGSRTIKKKNLFAETAIYLIPSSLGSGNAPAVKNQCALGQRWLEVYLAVFYLNCCVGKLLTKEGQRKSNYPNESFHHKAGDTGIIQCETAKWNFVKNCWKEHLRKSTSESEIMQFNIRLSKRLQTYLWGVWQGEHFLPRHREYWLCLYRPLHHKT